MKNKFMLIIIFIITLTIIDVNNIKANQKYEININYKKSEYKLLNEVIDEKINKYIKTFKSEMDIPNIYYTLNINSNVYEYKNYISYVFFIETYLGGNHPSHNIFTINYDKSNNTIIDIDTLLSKYPNILNIFSKISRKKLLYNKNIVDTNIMLEGTKPIKDNFSNFVFSKKGIILFFEYYQVAPYSSGEFQIIIPYKYFTY